MDKIPFQHCHGAEVGVVHVADRLQLLRRGQRVYLWWGPSTRRPTDPAIEPEEVPPLHAVVLSHLHGDHLDRVARVTHGRRRRRGSATKRHDVVGNSCGEGLGLVLLHHFNRAGRIPHWVFAESQLVVAIRQDNWPTLRLGTASA